MTTTSGRCEGCGEHSVLMPLHGPKGGPLRCPLCVGAWNAKHGRKRRTGRVVIRAMKAFMEAGGGYGDLDKLKLCAFAGGQLLSLNVDPLGYMAGAARLDDPEVELTSELLADVLKLTHPDHQPPERQQLAHTVTQRLLALQPFVFPALKPEPPKPTPTTEQPGKPSRSEADTDGKASKPLYPCADCASTVPYFYCDACKAERDKRNREEIERRREKARKQYARRPKMWTPPKPPKGTPKPRTARQETVAVNQLPRGNLINHGLSGLQAAILTVTFTKRPSEAKRQEVFRRKQQNAERWNLRPPAPDDFGPDIYYNELLAEIWGWKPRRYKNGAVMDRRAFCHIAPHILRSARASLGRALARLEKRHLIERRYWHGPVLTAHGERLAQSIIEASPSQPPPVTRGELGPRWSADQTYTT
jgi:hypothetical protein